MLNWISIIFEVLQALLKQTSLLYTSFKQRSSWAGKFDEIEVCFIEVCFNQNLSCSFVKYKKNVL